MNTKSILIGVGLFIAGGIATYFLLPTVIKTEVRTEIVEKEVEVIVEKEIIKEVVKEIEKEVVRSEKRVVREEVFPDGRILREEIYESNEEQISRIKENERNRYEELLASRTKETEERTERIKTITNPKKLDVFAGINPGDRTFLGGFSYNLWGPLNVGTVVTQGGEIYPTIGIRF